METEDKYREMGFVELGRGKVQDRSGNVYYPKKAKSPQKAIKMFCRECVGMDRRKKETQTGVELVRDCPDPMCPLFEFRMGKNPFLKRTMTDEQRIEAAERMNVALGR